MNELFNLEVMRQHAFAVADAAMAEPLPNGLITQRLVPNNLASSAHLMPTLINLNRARGQQLNDLSKFIQNACANAQAPPVALFIKTNASEREMVRHWNSMQVAQPQPGHKLWLRLHDPRVMHQLLRILNPTQRRNLFGLSVTFTYWIGGEWIKAERDFDLQDANSAQARADVEPFAGPARWDWPRIERIGLINRALHGAGIQQPIMLSSSGALAEQLIERAAQHHGFVEQVDLVEFAIRGLTTHPAFDQHPVVIQAIKPDAALGEDSTLPDRLALLEEQVWNELRQSRKMLQESLL
ncbi:DUF4123 domain-containing protein [Massilia suwonensis]|uniref:DUF4123 domain-containing protein n=1 Tax=Massilia suwonensis TaxID=648895 RepID=A0ABW0MHA7_9BURK